MSRIASLLIFFALLSAPAWADEQLRVGNLLVEFHSRAGGLDMGITISGVKSSGTAKAFFVGDPSRLVVDVTPPVLSVKKGIEEKFSSTYILQTTGLLRMRIGQTPERLRIVVDIKATDDLSALTPTVTSSANSIHIVAEGINGVKASTPATTTTSLTSTTTSTTSTTLRATTTTTLPPPVKTAPPTTTTTIATTTTLPSTTSTTTSTTTTSSTTTTLAPVPSPAPSKSASNEGTLQKISFGQDGSLILRCDKRVNYTLIKRGESTVSLLFEGMKLAGDYLALEQFPPQNFAGVQAVVAKPEKNGISVEIVLEPGERVESSWNDTSLLIKPLK